MVKNISKVNRSTKKVWNQAQDAYTRDNECSEEFKQAIKGNNMKYQLVPPQNHCRNIAERAIQTFKVHLISTLCRVWSGPKLSTCIMVLSSPTSRNDIEYANPKCSILCTSPWPT